MKKIIRNFLLYCYKLLRNFPFTKRYVAQITRLFENIKPQDEDSIALCTMKLLLKSNGISFLILLFCFSFSGGTIYYYISVLSLIYFFNHQLISVSLEKEEYKLLKQLEKYLGDVRHYYHAGGMVEEAVYDSLEDADKEISLHMSRIYEVLCNDDQEEIEKYRESAPNKFFTTFLALCQVTIIYGDTLKEEASLFLSNLIHLKNEIHVELLKREKVKHVFSGLIFITILPVFFLKAIEDWSISNLPELELYYHGSYGILVTIVIFLSTLFSYHLVNRLKGNERVLPKKHRLLENISNYKIVNKWLQRYIFYHTAKVHRMDLLLRRTGEGMTVRQYLIQKAMLFFFTFLLSVLVFFHVVSVSRSSVVDYTKNFKGTSIVNEESQVEEYRSIISELTKEYRQEKSGSSLQGSINQQLSDQYNLTNEYNRNALTDEIIRRVVEYQSYTYQFLYLLISLFLALCVCNMPLVILACKRHFLTISMEDEVIQFHSIIIMLMHIKRMNVETILEWMENFSEIFRPSIMECVDLYDYDDEAALEKLKMQEPFLPFVRIVENLEACDRVGIEKAFDEIASQRSYFAEKRKQDNEINISNKGAVGKVVAYIPMILTLSLYLIIPFVLESISQLMGYINQLQGI